MTRSSRESRAVSDALEREPAALAHGVWHPTMVPAAWDGRRMTPLVREAPQHREPVREVVRGRPPEPERRVMWTEWVGGERRQTVITVTELQHRVAGWVTTAMAYSPEDRKRDDVSRWIDQTRQNIVTFASLGLIPVDRATFVLGQLREVAGPSGAQPIVVNVEPTPVVIENHVDASPKGDIAFAYDKLGRLAGLTRTPAEPS